MNSSFNPYSNIENLNLKNISNDDKTPIFHINIKNLSLNDIFIDKYNHYWSISQELVILKTNKNPFTNQPFEDDEWIRIRNAIKWYFENQKDEINVNPIPQMSMNNSNVLITNTTNTITETHYCQRNCYITPVHGFVNNICFCFPFCSFFCGDKKLTICEGEGEITCNNKLFYYHWEDICTIHVDNNNNDSHYRCLPFFCSCCDKEIWTYYESLTCATPICCCYKRKYFFLGIPLCMF